VAFHDIGLCDFRTSGSGISPSMIRPCFLVVDKRSPGNISTRKLVIETALLNVVTAYSAEEAVQTLARFPNVDGIVMDTEMAEMSCRELIDRLRAIRREIPIVTVSPSGHGPCGGEQHHCSSYRPHELLDQLEKICPREKWEAAQENGLSR
jgi:response regulator RpfG family c-di-GMP phosphodiesterase